MPGVVKSVALERCVGCAQKEAPGWMESSVELCGTAALIISQCQPFVRTTMHSYGLINYRLAQTRGPAEFKHITKPRTRN